MLTYLIKRIVSLVPVLIGITLITFGIIHLTPGGPTDTLTDMNPKVTLEAKQRLIELYGLDKPLHVQYFNWLANIARLDFGTSFRDGRPAIDKIAERLPATLLLNILSLALILLIALPLGVISALNHNRLIDRAITVSVFVGFSTPAFWLALLLMILFGLKLGWLPISGLHSLNYAELSATGKIADVARHLVLPVFVSAFTGLAGLSRYARTSMLEVIRQDYIRMAYAKGVPRSRIILHHAVRNALLPVVTILGLSLPSLIGGAFIFETIFAYPGMGRLGYEAVMARDTAVIMAVGVTAALLTLLGNLIADITYALVDPRIRYK